MGKRERKGKDAAEAPRRRKLGLRKGTVKDLSAPSRKGADVRGGCQGGTTPELRCDGSM
jgi:hypothetical protein